MTAWLAVVALVLLACGDDAVEDEPDGAEGSEAEEPGEDAVAEDWPASCETTQGVDDDTIHLTMMNDLTGPTAALGAADVGEAFEAYFEAVNDEGGIDGRMVEIENIDTAYSPVEAAQGYEEVRTETAMVASVFGSPPMDGIGQDLAEDCLLSFQNGSNGQLAQNYETVFAPTTTYGHEILNAIEWALEEGDGEDATWALAYQGDSLGEAVKTAAEFGAEFYGFEFEAEASHAPGDEDLSAQLNTLLEVEPDYIVYGGLPAQAASLSAGALAAGSQVQFLSATPGHAPAVLQTPAADAIEQNLLISHPYPEWEGDSDAHERMREVIETYTDDVVPGHVTVISYTAAMLVHEVLEAASEADDLSLGGLRRAAMEVDGFDADGLLPPLTYGEREDEPRIGSRASRMHRVDPETGWGLTPISEMVESDAVDEFVEPEL